MNALEAIRTRRVARSFTTEQPSDDELNQILQAAANASSGGNRRLQRLIVVRDLRMIRLIRAVSPGMHGLPTALIVICTDLTIAAAYQVDIERHTTRWIDVGTMAMNMMLATHAIGLGSCPLTSFSKPAIRRLLRLPNSVEPELMLQIGHPDSTPKPNHRRTASMTDFVHWETWS